MLRLFRIIGRYFVPPVNAVDTQDPGARLPLGYVYLSVFLWTFLLLAALFVRTEFSTIVNVLREPTATARTGLGAPGFFGQLGMYMLYFVLAMAILALAIRYAINSPFRIYERIVPCLREDAKRLPYASTPVSAPDERTLDWTGRTGWSNIGIRDVAISATYFSIQFYMLYLMATSLDNPPMLLLLVIALPILDLVWPAGSYGLYRYRRWTLMREAAKVWEQNDADRARTMRAELHELEKGIWRVFHKQSAARFFLQDWCDVVWPLTCCAVMFVICWIADWFGWQSPTAWSVGIQLGLTLGIGIASYVNVCVVAPRYYRDLVRTLYSYGEGMSKPRRVTEGRLLTGNPEDDVPRLTPKERGILWEAARQNTAVYASYCYRRRLGEPLAYILEKCRWAFIEFRIDRRAFVPCRETRRLALFVARKVRDTCAKSKQDGVRLIDVGTGCGNIAAFIAGSLAKSGLGVHIWATDESQGCVALAEANLARFKTATCEITVQCTHYVSDLDRGIAPHFVVANLPYGCPTYRLSSISERESAHMPASALYRDGLLQAYVELGLQVFGADEEDKREEKKATAARRAGRRKRPRDQFRVKNKHWRCHMFVETGVVPEDVVRAELRPLSDMGCTIHYHLLLPHTERKPGYSITEIEAPPLNGSGTPGGDPGLSTSAS